MKFVSYIETKAEDYKEMSDNYAECFDPAKLNYVRAISLEDIDYFRTSFPLTEDEQEFVKEYGFKFKYVDSSGRYCYAKEID